MLMRYKVYQISELVHDGYEYTIADYRGPEGWVWVTWVELKVPRWLRDRLNSLWLDCNQLGYIYRRKVS